MQIAIERLAQLVHQPLDLGVGRILGERILQLLLQAPQILLGQRHPAVLDTQRRLPEDLLDAGDGVLVIVALQAKLREVQREKDRGVVAVEHRPRVQIAKNLGDSGGRGGILRELPALIDQRPGNRLIEHALGERHLHGGALAGLAERIGRGEADLDRQARPGMRRQIVIARRLRLL